MRRVVSSVLVSLAALAVACGDVSAPPAMAPQALPVVHLQLAPNAQVKLQVAMTSTEVERGLENRSELGEGEGMLFAFADLAPRCFRSERLLIALDAAFVSDDGQVVNILPLEPAATSEACSRQPVRFALQMRKGWFAGKGIAAGSSLQLMPAADDGAAAD